MIELAPWLVFGPYSMKKFGNPLTATPEISLRVRTPTVVQTFAADADDVQPGQVVAGFEPRRQHDGVDVDGAPAAVTIDVPVTRLMGSVTRSTWGRCSAR